MPPDLCTRRATLEPATIDDTARTVDVVWSTGAGVRRRDAAGAYEERLSLEPAHVDLGQFVGGPVLDGHRQDSVENILGVVTAAHVDGRTGHATVKFSERAEPVWRDVKAGVLRSVSVGYVVHQWQDARSADGVRVRTAVRWTPKELSLVAIPADVGASTRGEPMPTTPTPEIPVTPAPPEIPTPAPPAELMTRNAEIRRLIRAANLEHTVADQLIDRGASVDDARRELFDTITATPIIMRHQRIEVGERHDAPGSSSSACRRRCTAA
jgi:hypothetical protein